MTTDQVDGINVAPTLNRGRCQSMQVKIVACSIKHSIIQWITTPGIINEALGNERFAGCLDNLNP
jgi:hypothetical protein